MVLKLEPGGSCRVQPLPAGCYLSDRDEDTRGREEKLLLEASFLRPRCLLFPFEACRGSGRLPT